MNAPIAVRGKTNIITYSGNYFDYVDLESNVVHIDDVAHGLSNECRFAGQCPQFYSVAQHSCIVAELVLEATGSKEDALGGLLHDASEAFIKDLPTPLKKMMPEYVALERRVQADMMRRFAGGAALLQVVHEMDLVALAIEKRDLLRNTDPWLVLVGMNPRLVNQARINKVLSPERAELEFLRM